jgi:hypothetical protein
LSAKRRVLPTADLSGVWRTAYDSPDQNERLFGPGVKAFVVPGDDPARFPSGFLDVLVDSARQKSHASRRGGAVPAERREKANSSSARCLPQGSRH